MHFTNVHSLYFYSCHCHHSSNLLWLAVSPSSVKSNFLLNVFVYYYEHVTPFKTFALIALTLSFSSDFKLLHLSDPSYKQLPVFQKCSYGGCWKKQLGKLYARWVLGSGLFRFAANGGTLHGSLPYNWLHMRSLISVNKFLIPSCSLYCAQAV